MEYIKKEDNSEDRKMLWETIGKPAYEKGLLEGRQEAGLYAVIPISILENKNLSANAKLLYGEIMALSKKSGKCYATNKYIAEILGLSYRSIPNLLKELNGVGLIYIDIKRNKEGTYRNIIVSYFNDGVHRSFAMGGIAKLRGQKRNRQIEIDKIKNGGINPPFREIIDYFIKSVEKSYDYKPKIDGGDGARLKWALKTYPRPDIEDMIDFYLKNKADRNGITLKAVFSTHSLNLYEQKGRRNKFL